MQVRGSPEPLGPGRRVSLEHRQYCLPLAGEGPGATLETPRRWLQTRKPLLGPSLRRPHSSLRFRVRLCSYLSPTWKMQDDIRPHIFSRPHLAAWTLDGVKSQPVREGGAWCPSLTLLPRPSSPISPGPSACGVCHSHLRLTSPLPSTVPSGLGPGPSVWGTDPPFRYPSLLPQNIRSSSGPIYHL